MAAPHRPSQARARLFYLLFFAAIASLVPFLVVYFEQIGLDGGQIGMLSAMLPVAMLTVGPLWGALADALGRHRIVALSAIAAAAVSGGLVAFGSDFATLVPLMAALAIFSAPIVPLTDTAVLAGLGGERQRYGRLRMWGAVGFGLSSLVAGTAVDRFGIGYSFVAFSALLVLTLVAASRLSWDDVSRERTEGRATSVEAPLIAGVGGRARPLAFLTDFLTVRWVALLTAGLLGGAALAPNTTFVYLYFAERGAATGAIGIALAVATISEIPVMFLAGRWLVRFGPRTLLLTALGVYAVRSALYGALDTTAGLVAVQLLHGPSFALLLVAGVARADRLAIPGRRATGQALFTASVMGLGAAIGSLGGGALYEALGPRPTFFVVAATMAVTTTLLALWRVDDDGADDLRTPPAGAGENAGERLGVNASSG